MSQISIREIHDQSIWDSFQFEHSPSIVLQSWNWGQFQKRLKRKVWYLGIYEKDTLVGTCLCHMIPTRMRTHLYTSNGPVLDWDTAEPYFTALVEYLKKIAIKENALFVRLDPLLIDNPENLSMLARRGLKQAKTNVQAENKWILDITPEEQQLLTDMRKNTRYAIRKAEKEGVVIKSSSDSKHFDKFWNLFIQTVEVQKFVPHSKNYYIKQIESFMSDKTYSIYWAEYKKKVLASALIASYGDTSYYLHAASSSEERNVFPAHALIWQAIKDSKKRGQHYFDFWGIAPSDDPKHPWAGFTFFKKGFGGFRQDVIRAHDLPLSPWYPLVRILESTRRTWGRIYYTIINSKG